MKYIFSICMTLKLMIAISYGQVTPVAGTNLLLHNSCVTAKKVCSEASIFEVFNSVDSCLSKIPPQYFKYNFSSSGMLNLNTYLHSGSYTLFGPFSDFDLNSCNDISLGNSYELSDTLSGVMQIPHNQGHYILKVEVNDCQQLPRDKRIGVHINTYSYNLTCNEEADCIDCLSSFAPSPGKYIISAWVKGASVNKNTSYVNPKIRVSFTGHIMDSIYTTKGLIIDGWQKIEEEVIVPANATDIKIELNCQSGSCYFDDIRFVPLNGSMKSYVYDPISKKLVAELDERNYATFYEYDEEGKLIRVKKETEKGIMTIQENRNSIIKR